MWKTVGVFVGLMVIGVAVAIGLRDWSCENSDAASTPSDQASSTNPTNSISNTAASTDASNVVPPVACPVEKPASFPLVLATLSRPADSMASANAQMDAVESLRVSAGGEELNALRWLLWQKDRDLVLRNIVSNRLDQANPAWLSDDYIAMAGDLTQTKEWRAYCVQHLKSLCAHYQNEAGEQALLRLASGTDAATRDQAIYSLSELAQEKTWADTKPEAYARVVAASENALVSDEPSTQESGLRAAMLLKRNECAEAAEGLAANAEAATRVRVAAVQALGVIGRAESLPVLAKCQEIHEPKYVILWALVSKNVTRLSRIDTLRIHLLLN